MDYEYPFNFYKMKGIIIYMKSDTIAAIATAMSPSGIGIIRLSGTEAFSIIDKIYRSRNGKKKISACDSHTIHYGYIYDGEEWIDEVMVLVMKAPNTYTKEARKTPFSSYTGNPSAANRNRFSPLSLSPKKAR